MRTQLFAHNKTAYRKVMEALKASDRTCVCHPTGTGKSYLIAAVSENFESVLILAPNIFVLKQVQEVTAWHKGIDYMTYQLLTFQGINKHYDLIVLDEFHRTGADEWGEAVTDTLIDNNGKVLGTSATPIRYLDGERNMADEIFHGNIASEISIAEAWNRNILPLPTYVTGLYDFSKTAKETAQYIRLSKTLTADEKRDRMTRLSNLEMDWQQSGGMPIVLRKHISQDTQRIIVFCGNIGIMRKMKATIREWFTAAGLRVADIYSVSSDLSNTRNRKTLARFEQDTDRGIKIMLSVNMLNEGIHIPRVDAVIMLRTTSSRIIYMQQLGRCLTAANTARPVVLDMVDNITGVNVIHGFRDEYNKLEAETVSDYTDEEIRLRQFNIIDYTESVREVISKLGGVHTSTDFKINEVEHFCKEHGRTPGKNDGRTGKYWFLLLTNNPDHPKVITLREKYGSTPTNELLKQYTFSERKQMVSDFCQQHDRLPRKKDGDIYIIYQGLRNSEKGLQYFREMIAYFRNQAKEKRQSRHIEHEDTDLMMSALRDFCQQHGRLPGRNDGIMNNYLNRLRGRDRKATIPGLREIIDKYKRQFDKEGIIAKIETFTHQHGRLPSQIDGEVYILWCKMTGSKRAEYQDPRIRQLMKQYPRKRTHDQLIADWLTFCETHHRLPGSGGLDGEKSLSNFALRHRNELLKRPDTLAMFKKYFRYKKKDRL